MQIINAYSDKLLSFGVPLEDVFGENDVHPALKNLFEIAYKTVARSGFPITSVTSSLRGSLSERFLLKEQLLAVGYFSGDEASPGAYLWLVRHFLGLLPLPLLPMKTHNQRQPWNFLCDLCEKLLTEPCSKICSTFCFSIARYINTLPDANRMLLLNLMSLLIGLADFGNNNKAFTCLADFFASALFVRPYYPGNGIKFCRHGYYLMVFLLVHWDAVDPLCKIPRGFEVQIFENRNVKFTKHVRTSLPLLEREGHVYQNLLDFERKKYRQLGDHKATQTFYQLSRSVSEQSLRSSKCSSSHPINIEEAVEDKNKEGNITKESPPETKITNDENADPQLSGEDEYFYDEDYKEQADSFNRNEAMLERVAKVGWSYTPSTVSPRIGWNIIKESYNLSFDNNESDCEEPKAQKPEEPTDEKHNQKSVISLQSIQSKLKFFKKMRPSRCGVKKSTSTQDAPSKIKYKKMDCSRNNSF